MPESSGHRYLNEKRVQELSEGKYSEGGWIAAKVQAPLSYGRDDLGSGVLNPANGKMYDSKSAYYRSVKDMGLEIVGNDPIVERKPKQKPIDWERAVAETLKQKPLKGK